MKKCSAKSCNIETDGWLQYGKGDKYGPKIPFCEFHLKNQLIRWGLDIDYFRG